MNNASWHVGKCARWALVACRVGRDQNRGGMEFRGVIVHHVAEIVGADR
jgi:hypothetical protein